MTDHIRHLIKSQVLNALSYYVEGGEDRDINFGMGSIQLDNVVLKPQALTKGKDLHLPFRLLSATIGSLKIDIPLLRFFVSQPFKVVLENVRVEASPQTTLPTEAELIEYIKFNLQSQSEAVWGEIFRVLRSLPAQSPLLGDDDDPGFMGSAMARIKNNIRIEMINVSFCLGTLVGVHLNRLELFTAVDESFSEGFDKTADRVVCKVGLVRGLTLSVNNKQVIDEVDLDLLIKLDANPFDVEHHPFGLNLRLLCTKGITIHLDLATVKAVLEFASAQTSYQTQLARLHARAQRGYIRSLLPIEEETHAELCRARVGSKDLSAAPSAQLVAMDVTKTSDELRAFIWSVVPRPPAVAPPIKDFSPSPEVKLVPLLSVFPLLTEFDLVSQETTTVAVEEDSHHLVVTDPEFFPALVTSSVIVGLNGFSLEGLEAVDKLRIFRCATKPVRIRFANTRGVLPQSASMAMKVLVPTLTLEVENNRRGVVFGLDMSNEIQVHSVSSRLGVLGIEGDLGIWGGMGGGNTSNTTPAQQFFLSPSERTELLLHSNEARWRVINARSWRNMTRPALISLETQSQAQSFFFLKAKLGTVQLDLFDGMWSEILGWLPQPQPAALPPPRASPPLFDFSTVLVDLSLDSFALVLVPDLIILVDKVKLETDKRNGRFCSSFTLSANPLGSLSVHKCDLQVSKGGSLGLSVAISPKLADQPVMVWNEENIRLALRALAQVTRLQQSLPPAAVSETVSLPPRDSPRDLKGLCVDALELVLGKVEPWFALDACEAEDLFRVLSREIDTRWVRLDRVWRECHNVAQVVSLFASPPVAPMVHVGLALVDVRLHLLSRWQVKLSSFSLGLSHNLLRGGDVRVRGEILGFRVKDSNLRGGGATPLFELKSGLFSWVHQSLQGPPLIEPREERASLVHLGSTRFKTPLADPLECQFGAHTDKEDEVAVRLVSIKVRLTYASVKALHASFQELNLLLAPDATTVPPQMTTPAKETPSPSLMASLSLFGLEVGLENLTQTAPKTKCIALVWGGEFNRECLGLSVGRNGEWPSDGLGSPCPVQGQAFCFRGWCKDEWGEGAHFGESSQYFVGLLCGEGGPSTCGGHAQSVEFKPLGRRA